MLGSCVASGRTDANAGAAEAGNSCRRRGCMARWGLLVCSHFTFAHAHPAGTLRESCMRENCTCSLSGGRRPACSSECAPPPTRLGNTEHYITQNWNYNYVPLGTRFQPQLADPTNPAVALPSAFLRPNVGYLDMIVSGPA